MQNKLIILFIFVLLLSPAYAFDRSDFYYSAEESFSDWGYGCQIYYADFTDYSIDTTADKPTVEYTEKYSEVKSGSWDVLITTNEERSVWVPKEVCGSKEIYCDPKNDTYKDCDEKSNTTNIETCWDNGSFEKQTFEVQKWQAFNDTYKFPKNEKTKLRFCSKYEMQSLPKGGWGAEIDVIPTFGTDTKYKYDEYAWFNASWLYRQPCHVNTTVSSSLVNFTAYCKIDTATLITAGKMNTSCEDLRVANTSDIALDYEIEANTCNTTDTLVWFGIPATGASANTTVYIYYGNPSATDAQNPTNLWRNAGYVGVWHFAESSGGIIDSAGYNNLSNFTAGTGKITYNLNSNLGKAIELNSTTSQNAMFINITQSGLVGLPSGANPFTYTWWQNKTSANGCDGGGIIWQGGTSQNQQFKVDQRTPAPYWTRYNYNSVIGQSYDPFDSWQFMGANQSGSIGNAKATTWKNGSVINQSLVVDGGGIQTQRLIFGGDNGSINNCNIITFTEIRVRNQSSSSDWIKAEYAQTYALSSEESVVISFVSQSPADITSTNAINYGANITYNITNAVNGTQAIYFKTNTSSIDGSDYLNGSLMTGYEYHNYSNIADGITTLFRISDNDIYPSSDNLDYESFRETAHNQSTITGANQYHSIELLNVSNSTQYGFFEAMYNASSATAVRIYYCNQTYDFSSNPTTNANCVQFDTEIANGAYDHCHDQYGYNNSCHRVSIFPVNTSAGTINNIKITSKSYFLIRGNTGQTISFHHLLPEARPGVNKISTNNGATWTNQTYTLDSHIHQFTGAETFYYYACGNSSAGSEICSAVRSDLLDLAGLPPSAPIISVPTNTTYYKGTPMTITYTASESPNGYAITNYNISLYNTDLTFNQTIQANNSNNLTYSWNFNSVTAGAYIIQVNATDNMSQNSTGYSEIFTIDEYINFVSPTPVNGVNNFTYGMIFNYSSITALSGDGYIEIDGTNKTCTRSADNLSCAYTLPYAEHIFNNSYDIKPWANISGVYYTNSTLYNFSYYGCGYVNGNATMIGNVTIDSSKCFYINSSNTFFEGNGYQINGSVTTNTDGIEVASANTTINRAIIYGFQNSIKITATNNIVENSSFNTYGGVSSGEEYGIFSNGTYLTAKNNTFSGGESGIGMYADNYLIDSNVISVSKFGVYSTNDNGTITHNTVNGGSSGLLRFDSVSTLQIHHNTLIGGSSGSIWLQTVTNANITNNSGTGNAWHGITLTSSNSNNISNCTFANTGRYGIRLSGSNSNIFDNIITYNNSWSNIYLSSSNPVNMTGIIIGDSTGLNKSNITLHDAMGGEAYYINWSVNSTSLPTSYFSFANRFVNISTESGTPSIDTFIHTWTDAELGTSYNESKFHLYKYNASGWTDLNSTPDTTNNQISYFNFNPASDYGILELNFSASFVAPSPANASNTSDNPIVFNISSTSAMVTPCFFEINGTNYTQTAFTSDNLSCYYTFYPNVSAYTYNFTGWVNNSGVMTQVTDGYSYTTWYNDSTCLRIVDVFDLVATDYISIGDTWLYVNSTITLNNSCPTDINNLEYDLNESTADATWITYFVSISGNEVKNFTNYRFRVPVSFTEEGTVAQNILFSHPNNNLYRINSSYSRDITTMMVTLPSPGEYRSLYKCENNSVPCDIDGSHWSVALQYNESGDDLLRIGDMITYLEYIISWEGDGGVGNEEGQMPPTGGGGGGAPYLPATPPSTTNIGTPETTLGGVQQAGGMTETEKIGAIIEKRGEISANQCCLPIAILLLLVVLSRRRD